MIDLHSHSIFSDGTETPEALALLGDRAGLTALALTDHDTLDGLPRFLAMQDRVRPRLVPGIELSCRFLGREVHILGLLLDPASPALRARVEGLRLRREARNAAMIGRLQAMGLPITAEDVAKLAPTRLVSRAHIARALVAAGAAHSPQDAFQRLVGDGCPGHVAFHELSPRDAADWIMEAGGIAVLAHPGRTFGRAFRWGEAMADLKAMGIRGLEAHYADYGPEEERTFVALARDLDLARSGGSDFHGANKPGIALGTGRGRLQVPDEVLRELQDRAGPLPA
jgi:3',5'-nucleoside bisphosphate phosphatase